MKTRVSSDKSDTVGLFPFLAVLLCTMGALLVILVVLVQRAAERAALEATAQPDSVEQFEPVETVSIPNVEEAQEADALKKELAEVHQYQQKLKELQARAETRLRDEQERLSHLEEHTRRIEHELAKLSIAANQLEATEKNQTVDQDQAEDQLTRMKSLIEENEERVDELREQADGSHSYAIVPYQGPNGTYRKPIYIECCKDGVIIQPAGIRLTEADFAMPKWAGNPLAAALRASRTHLNQMAAKAGEPEPPDPYPLLLVRPDGIGAYSAARTAITAWDSDYGYEFIAGDWKLDFKELPNPVLAQIQNHAILNARENMAMLARAAPSRFRAMGIGGSGAGVSGGGSGSPGYGEGGSDGSGGQHDTSTGNHSLANSAEGGSVDGNGLAAGEAKAHYDSNLAAGAGQSGQQGEESQYGAMAGGVPGNEANGPQASNGGNAGSESSSAGSLAGGSAGNQQGSAANSANGATQNSGAAAGSFAQGSNSGQSGQNGSPNGASASGGSSQGTAANGQQASGGAAAAQAPTANLSFAAQSESIAESRGSDWAIKRSSSRSVPIRRPIEVVVRKNQLAILASRHSIQNAANTGTVISLNKPVEQVSQEFVEALQAHIKEWGLAGNGLYWRPVLELKVGPEAQQTAYGITRLLKNSGVEVRLPEMAHAGQGEATHAPK